MNISTLPEEYQAAFKDADIRGHYPYEIDETVAYRVGRALVALMKAKTVVVARDMRISSPSISDALIQGIRDGGGTVQDIGLVPTTALYYASGTWQSWGVMVTASHNPPDYSGLKIVRPGAIPLTKVSGLKEIQQYVKKFSSEEKVAGQRGKKQTRKILRSYIKAMEREVPLTSTKPLKIVADAGNGMASMMLSELSKSSAYKIDILNKTLDGTFPARASNPMLRKNQGPIRQALKSGSYDLGISFDGDGDRVAFFLPNGKMLNGAVVGAMFAEQLLVDQPEATFVDTVFNSRIYHEVVRKAGGKVKKARVGHSFIKEMMRKHDAIFACEHSGHYYFKANFYTDSSLLALRYMVRAIAAGGGGVEETVRPYQKYHQTEEILVKVADKQAVLKKVAQQYQKQAGTKIHKFDGVTVDRGDVWFTVKQSVTEDALKFLVEAPKRAQARATQKEIHQFLKDNST